MGLDRDEVSRRLKAARALRGVTVSDLARLEPLRINGISANLVGETERQDRDARQMELRVIAEALELPTAFFEVEDLGAPTQLDRIERLLRRVLVILEPSELEETEGGTLLHLPRRSPEEILSELEEITAEAREAAAEAERVAREAGQQQSDTTTRSDEADQRPDGP